MFNELHLWLTTILGSGYQYSRGMWIDNPALSEQFICSMQSSGGPAIDVDDRRPNYRVVLLGPRNSRQSAEKVQLDADTIVVATMEAVPPCGAAAIRAIAEPIGPGYTTENRAWAQVDLQITF